VLAGAWLLAAALALRRAVAPRPWRALSRPRGGEVVWGLTLVLCLVLLLCLTDLHSISLTAAALGAIAVVIALRASERLRLPVLSRPWRIATDAGVLLLVALAVPDLFMIDLEGASGNLQVSLHNGIIQFHQNFLLGPANEVIHGRAMLVDTSSQYGVGSIYLLAGWFKLAPIGYGTAPWCSWAPTAAGGAAEPTG
jgi:hypothetical protein